MARLEELLDQVQASDVREALAEEIRKLKSATNFGLTFERHIPEFVRLPQHQITAGSVVIDTENPSAGFLSVLNVIDSVAVCERTNGSGPVRVELPISALTVVKRFGESIYPSLKSIDRIVRSSDRPFHSLIEADNYHALQLLQFTHRGRVDLIYIDPPYNTGAKDWRYNNDFVDRNDAWRHSKWLSFMERRLTLAKNLLKPDGVLIVAIDDYEVHHLGMLLEQVFREYSVELIVVEHHPQGAGSETVSRTHEYAFVCIPKGVALEGRAIRSEAQRWALRRSGQGENNWRRNRPNQFFAVLVDPQTNAVLGVGPEIDRDESDYPRDRTQDGLLRIYPIDGDGKERVWRYNRRSMKQLIDERKIVCSPRLALSVLKDTVNATPVFSVWTGSRYNAGLHGSALLTALMGEANTFPYPKSIYTVLDMLRMVVGNKKSAVILDCFGGSGTTLHATALLNEQSDSNHQCILVTNNEVGDSAARQLSTRGIRPGSPEWEARGICQAVTWPRCKAAVSGKRADGSPVPGEYVDGGEIAEGFEENIEYFRLGFLQEQDVELGRALPSILPILWLRSGSLAECPTLDRDEQFVAPPGSSLAVLIDERVYNAFAEAVETRENVQSIFLVTDSDDSFREMASGMSADVELLQLYDAYLRTFRVAYR